MTRAQRGVVDTMKDYLADPIKKIQLDDYVTGLLKSTIAELSSDAFWANLPGVSPTTIQNRLHQYEKGIEDITRAIILLARWGQPDQLILLEKIFTRLAAANKSMGGLVIWQSMRWYPLGLLTYSAGIAALSANNYPALRSTILPTVSSASGAEGRRALVVQLADEINAISDVFKGLPGHERQHTPRSEYYFEVVRRPIEELLFLGDDYEMYFDKFEIISALAYADLTQKARGHVWAMPGRFGWKHAHSDRGPFNLLVMEAESQGAAWPLLLAGLFGSSPERFSEITKGYRELLGQMNWY